MSDEDEFMESSDEDFSASEDEWKPSKEDIITSKLDSKRDVNFMSENGVPSKRKHSSQKNTHPSTSKTMELSKKRKESVPKVKDALRKKAMPSSVGLSTQLETFSKNLTSAKERLAKMSSIVTNKHDNCNVSELLAMGEGGSSKPGSRPRKRKVQENSSDSDWEDVQDIKRPEQQQNVEIVLEQPKAAKKEIDMEAYIRRKINQVIKDQQIFVHKVSLLCWIKNGSFSNTVLNNTSLMGWCLKLIPNASCYPKNRTNLSYFRQITKWFPTAVKICDDRMYPKLKGIPSLYVSLGLQIKTKKAICKRDFVMIFICLLRAIGIQCRLVMNVVPNPLRPATSDLCSLKRVDNKKVKMKEEPISLKLSSKGVGTKKELPKLSSKLPVKLEKVTKIELNREESSHLNSLKSSSKVVPIKEEQPIDKKMKSSPKIESKVESFRSPIMLRSKKKTETDDKSVVKNLLKTAHERGSKQPKKEVDLETASNKKQTQQNKKKSESSTIKKSEEVLSPHFATQDTNRPSTSQKCTRGKSARSNLTKSVKQDTIEDSLDQTSTKNVKPLHKNIQNVKRDRKLLSTDDELNNNESKNEKLVNVNKTVDVWVEAYSEEEEQWVSIDLFSGKVHDNASIIKTVTQPLAYVLAWSNNNTVKDVSARYCAQWNTTTRKLRVNKEWFDASISQYLGPKTHRDANEDEELNKIHIDKPLPTTISEFKNHPLYALKRHLLKFEAFYPADCPSLGFIRGEPVYARDCVHTLRSRDTWLKEARTVKMGESPYKVVLARPKWDRHNQVVIKNLPLEIFGIWQTQDYEPPTAENGVVPRNAYGNVELFKPCMLPKKTVLIKLPGINKICRKLSIDCAPAMIGFDFHGGATHPVYEGFVVCEEFEDVLREAWDEEQSELELKEERKVQDRALSNWKKLIKGLWIRKRLDKLYKVNAE